MGANIIPYTRARTRVFAWWQIFNSLGLVLVMLLPVFFAEQMVNDSSFTGRTMGGFVLATVPITIAIAVLSIREGKAPSQVHEAKLRDYLGRSEERRVGKECVSTCRSRWSTYH